MSTEKNIFSIGYKIKMVIRNTGNRPKKLKQCGKFLFAQGGGLDENGLHRLIWNDTIRGSGFAGVGVVTCWRKRQVLRFQMLKAGPMSVSLPAACLLI